MILDFFGMRLVNRQSGQIERKKKFEARYKNLQESSHNYLRITRILKFLGEIEKLEHFQAPLVTFLLDDMLHLELTNASDSLVTYFIPIIRDEKAREKLMKRAETLKPPDEMPLEMRIQSLRDRLDVLVDIEKKNVIFSSLIGQIIAFRFIHFGYLPHQTYLLFSAIFLSILMIYILNKLVDILNKKYL